MSRGPPSYPVVLQESLPLLLQLPDTPTIHSPPSVFFLPFSSSFSNPKSGRSQVKAGAPSQSIMRVKHTSTYHHFLNYYLTFVSIITKQKILGQKTGSQILHCTDALEPNDLHCTQNSFGAGWRSPRGIFFPLCQVCSMRAQS